MPSTLFKIATLLVSIWVLIFDYLLKVYGAKAYAASEKKQRLWHKIKNLSKAKNKTYRYRKINEVTYMWTQDDKRKKINQKAILKR